MCLGIEISIVDVLCCIDGLLVSVCDIGFGDLFYLGFIIVLIDVWCVLCVSMWLVLEEIMLVDVVGGVLFEYVV